MAKITLPTIESGYLSAEAINAAFAAIETAINNTLSRDGSTPNQMEANLDLNGYSLLNPGGDVDDPDTLVTREVLEGYVDERANGILTLRSEVYVASAGQTVFPISQFSYEPGADNLAVYVDGVRKFPTLDFTETDSATVTFLAGLSDGQEVVMFNTEFLSNVTLPEHTHTWADLTGLPDFATRWPTWTEVTGKPTTFTATAHNHAASEITSGRIVDARRGVYVQATQPTAATVGEIWIW